MKNRYPVLPIIALLLSPSLLQAAFPDFYKHAGPLQITLFNIAWLWAILFSLMLINWLIRQIRS
ncbi:hypothetical protein [Spirosoma sp.]|uniref:hypothetical protein n=1 Tax=Spirosoma sp. TaxID=1899569 RepID=UPI003B3B4FAD